VTATELGALILGLSALVTALAQLVVAVRSHGKLETVQRAVNGQSERLVEVTHLASFAAGVSAERESPGNVGKTPTDIVGKTPTTD